jgi:exosortase
MTALHPAALWLGAAALATLPAWQWAAARFADGSDDPLGALAILAIALLAWRDRAQLRSDPEPRFALLAACALLCFVFLSSVGATHLLLACVAMLALCAVWFSLLHDRSRALPLLLLAALALPLIASLQFYAGFPLRVLTAELSVWALRALGAEASREGASMIANGQLVIVDAPCSGVQMAWFAYFSAGLTATLAQLKNSNFALRLPLVGCIVIVGNVLRNTVLVASEARVFGESFANSAMWHEAVGLFFLAAVCAACVALMNRRST